MQVNRIRVQIQRERKILADTCEILKGSISKVALGRKKKGVGHRVAYMLTYKTDENITKSVYIQKPHLSEVKTMLRNYKRTRRALNKLVALNLMHFKALRARERAKKP